MEDNKDLLKDNNDAGNQTDLSTDALNEELEQIAATLREELAKAMKEQADSGKADETSEETDEASEETGIVEETEESEPISEEDLCIRCAERLKDKEFGENYEYCEECREEMKRVPLGFSNVLIAVLIGVMAVLSVITFSNDIDGYYCVFNAKKNKENKMLDSAILYYDTAINYFEGKKINTKNLYLESAEIIFKTMPQGTASMSQVSNRIAEALSGNSSKLPIYNKSLALRNESLMLYGVMESFYGIVNKPEYANYTADNTEMYNDIMAEVESLVGTELSIKTIDGQSTETVVVSEGMVRFCQYMFAYTSERFDEANEYLKKVYELEPDYVWLYGYELAIVNIKNGEPEKAEELANIILENNKEESDGYCVYSSVARMNGDTKKAIEWADTGLKYCPQDSELLRIKAMAYVVEGDLEEAKTVIDNALSYSEYGILYYTAIVIENELGNTETVNNMIMLLENNGLKLSDKLNDYLSGKITAKQMFTEGNGEVE